MPTVTLIPTALHGSMSAPFNIPTGSPAHIKLNMVSPDFPTNAALFFGVDVQQSFDNGQTFTPWFSSAAGGGNLGSPGKGGVPSDGLWSQAMQWDGKPRLLQVNLTVPTPFVWGITGTITTK
jgi:hypothetical protein